MDLSRLKHGIQQGFMHGKKFLGQAYTDGKEFLSHLDNYAGIARGVIGAVALVFGQLAEWAGRFRRRCSSRCGRAGSRAVRPTENGSYEPGEPGG